MDMSDGAATSSQVVEFVEAIKKVGNDHFSSKRYADAEAQYSYGLSLLDNQNLEDAYILQLFITLLANRAQCSIAQGNYDEAVQSCDEGLAHAPRHSKLLYRRALACAHLGDGRAFQANRDALSQLGERDAVAQLDNAVKGLQMMSSEELDAHADCVVVSPGADPFCVAPLRVKKTDPRFGDAAPIPMLNGMGFPFAVVRLKPLRGPNPFVAFLMRDVSRGTAPAEWASDAGEVLLLRTDKQPVTVRHAWGLWDWMNHLMDRSNEGTESIQKYLDRVQFLEFMGSRPNTKMLTW